MEFLWGAFLCSCVSLVRYGQILLIYFFAPEVALMSHEININLLTLKAGVAAAIVNKKVIAIKNFMLIN